MKLFLVRHGRVVAPPGKTLMGRSGPGLEEPGRREAAGVAVMLEAFSIDAVLSSPVLRAHETARIIADAVGVPVELDDRLAELDFGAFEGQAIEGIPPELLAGWRDDPGSLRFPEGESLGEVQARMAAFIDEVEGRGGITVAVSHAFAIIAALCHLHDEPLANFRRYWIDTGSMTTVSSLPGEGRTVETINILPEGRGEG